MKNWSIGLVVGCASAAMSCSSVSYQRIHVDGVGTFDVPEGGTLVIVNALVGKDGRVKESLLYTRVGTPCDPCEAAALEATGDLEWTPGRRDGRATEVWVSVPWTFEHSGADADSLVMRPVQE